MRYIVKSWISAFARIIFSFIFSLAAAKPVPEASAAAWQSYMQFAQTQPAAFQAPTGKRFDIFYIYGFRFVASSD